MDDPLFKRPPAQFPFNLHSSVKSYKSLKDKVNGRRLIKAGRRSSYV